MTTLVHHYPKIQDFCIRGNATTVACDYLGKIIYLPINIPELGMERLHDRKSVNASDSLNR